MYNITKNKTNWNNKINKNMENNKIIIRDLKEKEMTVYNPDGSILVITCNYLCINDILIQIKEQSLEGYSISNGKTTVESKYTQK